MGITVGAALKRAAISILGNPKALKKLLFAVLVVFVIWKREYWTD